MLCSSPAGAKLLQKQLIWSAVGILVCFAAALFDYRQLRSISFILLAVTAVLLGGVFVPKLGMRVFGANRWLDLKFMQFQPSELAKLTLVMAIAYYVERFGGKLSRLREGFLYPALFIAPILALIFLEPDYGTTILLAAVSAAMLIVSGVRLRVIIPVAIIGLVLFGAAVMSNDVRRARVMAFLNPKDEKVQQNKGFQQYQAAIALGSGGVTGLGLGDGRQKHGYVPANATDFILATIGEELGLVATMGVVLAFIAIAVCGVMIGWRAPDGFGMMLACGITFVIAMQAFINVGVVTGVLPNKGLALPFVSYGGSSIVAMLGSVGLLFSVARHAREVEPRARHVNPFNPREIPSTQLS